VCADADRLAQVITNLLSNAIKFSPLRGEIVITIEQANRMGRLTVRDHGPGVPNEFGSRIFGKFAQVETGDARLRGGSGLGLNIARQIAMQHAGTITFENAPDGGAIFCLEMPFLDKAAGETFEREHHSAA
jgi:signal transduction histidine kinase